MRIRSDIITIRAIEDALRKEANYTEGIFTANKIHPCQDDMPSKAFTKIYEVYPDQDHPTMKSSIAEDIIWFLSPAIIVKFFYDYRSKKADIRTENGSMGILLSKYPTFKEEVERIQATVS